MGRAGALLLVLGALVVVWAIPPAEDHWLEGPRLIREDDPALEEGLRMIAERTQCEMARLASRGMPLWQRLQALAGCGHRQERRIEALEAEMARFREAWQLEQAYWRHLAEAGLTRRVEHVAK